LHLVLGIGTWRKGKVKDKTEREEGKEEGKERKNGI